MNNFSGKAGATNVVFNVKVGETIGDMKDNSYLCDCQNNKGLMFQGAIIVFSILVIIIAVCLWPWWVTVGLFVAFIVAIFFPSKNP